jgi:catalase
MPLSLSRSLSVLILLGMGTGLLGCNRPSARAEETAHSAGRADSGAAPAASPVRYQIVPVAGLANLDSAAAAKESENYLRDDLARRIGRAPVQFRLYAQLPNPGDPTNDGSIVWPSDRRRVLLGTIRLTKVEPNQVELQRSLAFNPTFLTSGIELSDDPLVELRSAVYALSVAHRH